MDITQDSGSCDGGSIPSGGVQRQNTDTICDTSLMVFFDTKKH